MSRREPSIGIYAGEDDLTTTTQLNGKRRRSISSVGSNSSYKENKPIIGMLGEAERLSPLKKRAPSLGEVFTPKRLREEVAAIKKTPMGSKSSERNATPSNHVGDTKFELLDFSTLTKNTNEPKNCEEDAGSTLTNTHLQDIGRAGSSKPSVSGFEDINAQTFKEINRLLTDNAKLMSKILDNQELVLRYQRDIKERLN